MLDTTNWWFYIHYGSHIFIIRIIIIIIKKLNSIFDTVSKIIQFMGSNK